MPREAEVAHGHDKGIGVKHVKGRIVWVGEAGLHEPCVFRALFNQEDAETLTVCHPAIPLLVLNVPVFIVEGFPPIPDVRMNNGNGHEYA